LLIVFELLLILLLIAIIFMQKTKGGMGGTAFGGGVGEAIFGSRMGNVLTKGTVVLGGIFLINTILLTILTARQQGGGSVMDSIEVAAPAPQPFMPAGMPGMTESAAQPPAGLTGPVEIPAPAGDISSMPDAASVPVAIPPPLPPAIEAAATVDAPPPAPPAE
jgi:preprotein translocase subunit SecG